MELKDRARQYFARLQDDICAALEALEPRARFREDRWKHEPAGGPAAGGGGIARVLAGGHLFEKAGVNLADLTGMLGPRMAERLEASVQPFYATGISLVIHPLSPLVPTVHMNLRLLQLLGPCDMGRPRDGTAWFGGGSDLTPYYLFEEDAAHFHGVWRAVCETHEPGCHSRFKKWCDEYFRLAHRDEARGVGGIFFDYLGQDIERTFDFVRAAGGGFLEAYRPIVERRMAEPWGERERQWQLVRRGRYVEFNLLHDRGTLFGLETLGRTESILMSLPPLVRWTYDHHPEPGSPEAGLIDVLRTPREW